MDFWKDTVTVYHRTIKGTSESWTRDVVENAFFKSTVIKNAQTTSLSMANNFIARLPVTTIVSEGDIIIHGAVNDLINEEFTAAKLLAKYKNRSFRVRHFADNSRYSPRHLKCEG